MESTERFVADGQHVGKVCQWCNTPVAVGHELAVCTACWNIHHANCWDKSLGCATQGCVNAPLATLPVQAPVANPVFAIPTAASGPQLPHGLKMCFRCRQAMPEYDEVCATCNAINTPDGLYHGPKTNAPGAVGAFVLSLVAVPFCGVILGPMAISRANKVRALIDSNPRLTGAGYTSAAKVIGIIATILSAISILYNIGTRMHH
ncbi:MAG TPA: hypothetical protein VF518_13270 [Polyangia bacterium]